jgi:hypothetical protein
MQLAQLLIVVSLVVVGVGFRRVLRYQAAQGRLSKTALLAWLVLFVGTLLVWNWAASHRMTARPQTLMSAPPHPYGPDAGADARPQLSEDSCGESA